MVCHFSGSRGVFIGGQVREDNIGLIVENREKDRK